MKIATWNVNSLRARLAHVLAWLEANPVDALCLQETKVVDELFPTEELAAAGWRAAYSGQKSYNGVAILTRAEPVDAVAGVPGDDDPERRVLAATVGGARVLNLYVVNGRAVDDPKYAHKLAWLERVTAYAAELARGHERLVVVGDFNVAPADADVHDPEAWRGRILCSEPERAALAQLQAAAGLRDCFRLFEQEPDSFSWWDYRQGGFRRNQGLRIDLILASAALDCAGCVIDRTPRGWEKPSDHAPVVAEFR